jgi:hypothetical protein
MKQKQKTILDQSETIECKDCGEEFELNQAEKEWYAQMDYQTPRRCKSCRQKKKERNQKYNNDQTCAGTDC